MYVYLRERKWYTYSYTYTNTYREAKLLREKEVDESVRERLVKVPEADIHVLLKALSGARGVGAGTRAR